VRILVVDDNRTNLELMAYLLQAFGHECIAASDGAEALEKARASRCDLALVDILMPVMDGYEFARRFRSDAALAGTPLVAVTALAMPGDHDRVLKAGFDGYIPKPIDPQRFVQQIEGHLRTHDTGSTQAVAYASVSGELEDRGGPVVLAVDDQQVNLDVIRASLMPFGYRVAEARSVREALGLIERALPAVIICDLHMPRESGFDLIERVREREAWRTIPFAFVSSTPWEQKDRQRGIALGVRTFIVRPLHPKRLRTEIEECISDGNDRRR
jgi:two-component system, cell cycle response regulator